MSASSAVPTPVVLHARQGFVAILPILVAAAPFGILVGAMAVQKGLAPWQAALMSASVFAGAAQFVAIDMWTTPASITALMLAALIINLRHVLMGASLAPHLRGYGPLAPLALFFLTDESWAVALRRCETSPLHPAFYFTVCGSLYLMWVSATWIGAVVGGVLVDPARWGFDFAFTAIFLCLIGGFWAGTRTLVPWAISAAVALLVHHLAAGVWHILAGALAGALAGGLLPANTAKQQVAR